MKRIPKPLKEINVRSSVAKCITFATASQEQYVEVRYENKNIWVSQKNDGKTLLS
ncbi:hypothetical protein AGMMS49921_03430 [Endomicrobiia bacterium]|nr:hypothetical protein AGMMS49921_03430 [Endomicrobiia bacterium]